MIFCCYSFHGQLGEQSPDGRQYRPPRCLPAACADGSKSSTCTIGPRSDEDRAYCDTFAAVHVRAPLIPRYSQGRATRRTCSRTVATEAIADGIVHFLWSSTNALVSSRHGCIPIALRWIQRSADFLVPPHWNGTTSGRRSYVLAVGSNIRCVAVVARDSATRHLVPRQIWWRRVWATKDHKVQIAIVRRRGICHTYMRPPHLSNRLSHAIRPRKKKDSSTRSCPILTHTGLRQNAVLKRATTQREYTGLPRGGGQRNCNNKYENLVHGRGRESSLDAERPVALLVIGVVVHRIGARQIASAGLVAGTVAVTQRIERVRLIGQGRQRVVARERVGL